MGNTLLDLPPEQPLVSASILSADFGCMVEDCRDVLARGADLLHVDVMDGHFAPNLTMGVDMVRGLRKHLPDVFLDVHLMVEKPGDFVEAFAKAGADLLSFHAELCDASHEKCKGEPIDAGALIDRIHGLGAKAGMVVNPGTAMEGGDGKTWGEMWGGIEPLLERLDLVLVMSVNPGYSGQAFMPEVLDKARWLRERVGPGTRIEMDGGLNPETAKLAAAAGVDVMVTASALFGKPREQRGAVIEALHASREG